MTKVFCDSEDDLKLENFNKRLRNLIVNQVKYLLSDIAAGVHVL
jgi:hypothetical protein